MRQEPKGQVYHGGPGDGHDQGKDCSTPESGMRSCSSLGAQAGQVDRMWAKGTHRTGVSPPSPLSPQEVLGLWVMGGLKFGLWRGWREEGAVARVPLCLPWAAVPLKTSPRRPNSTLLPLPPYTLSPRSSRLDTGTGPLLRGLPASDPPPQIKAGNRALLCGPRAAPRCQVSGLAPPAFLGRHRGLRGQGGQGGTPTHLWAPSTWRRKGGGRPDCGWGGRDFEDLRAGLAEIMSRWPISSVVVGAVTHKG